MLPVEEVQDDAFNTHYVDLTDGDQPVLMQKTPIVLTTFEDEGAPGLFTGLPIPCSVQVYHNNLPIDTFVVDDGELILDFALPGRYRVVFDAGVRFNCYEVVINA